ncbi:MAG: hypothetical protein ACXWOH_12850, partial [Bdellovibrionota bacterium]
MRNSLWVAPLAFTAIVTGLSGEAAGLGVRQNVLPAEPLPVVEAREPAAAARPFYIAAHSHNDYEQAHPLADALANRFDSVEADIWISKNDLLISHLGVSYKGSLRELYLEPLRR